MDIERGSHPSWDAAFNVSQHRFLQHTRICDAWFTLKITQHQPSGGLGGTWGGGGGAVGVSGYRSVCMPFLCHFPLSPEKQLLESAIPILSYASAGCKTGRLHEAVVPAAESQLRLLVHAAYLICLDARSFSSETQWAFFPISSLSYLLSPHEQTRIPPKQPHQLRNCPLVLQ